MTGIYCIENTVNGKKYIGKAINIDKRWTEHRRKLDGGKHYNVHLQRSWDTYGKESFSFYVVELCDKESLSNREIFYIQKFDSFKSGYNQTLGGDGTTGRIHPDEERKHMSEINKGKIFSEETKARLTKSKTGKHLGENNHMYGRHRTEREKNAVSKALSIPVVQYTLDGVFVSRFSSALSASKATGVHHAAISNVCNGRGHTAGGFVWKRPQEDGEILG